MTTRETIHHLLTILLNTILTDTPYPGQKVKQNFFPDVELIKGTETIILSDRNLEPPYEFDVAGYQIEVVPEENLQQRAAETGDFPYLSLSEVQFSGYSVVLTLQLQWIISEASRQSGKFNFGGGGVRVKFVLEEDQWLAPDGPMATWMH